MSSAPSIWMQQVEAAELRAALPCPELCPHCSSRAQYRDEGEPACLVCGWRPTRQPTRAEAWRPIAGHRPGVPKGWRA